THVPFRGFGPAMIGLLRNDIGALASDIPGALEHIRAGKLRALAVTANQRMAMLPDTPTVGEAGLRGYEAVGYLGFMVPAAAAPGEARAAAHAAAPARRRRGGGAARSGAGRGEGRLRPRAQHA